MSPSQLYQPLEDRGRLRRFALFAAIAVAAMTAVDTALRVPSGEWELFEVTLVGAVLTCCFLVVAWRSSRVSELRTVALLATATYAALLATLPFIPESSAVLALASLIPVFLALPYLDHRTLRRSAIAAWLFSLGYLVAAALVSAGGREPIDLRQLAFDIVGSSAVIALVLLLLMHHHRAESELRHLALHDGLTGLHNRTLFLDRLEHALAREERGGVGLGLLYLDIDDFKELNDRHGHSRGDEVLRVVARRLIRSVRATDTVARIGGDEFAILLEDVPRRIDAVASSERVLAELARPLELPDGGTHDLRVSGGLALSGGGGETADSLIQNADFAMYQGKRTNANALVVYHPALRAGSEEVRSIKRALQGIADRGELRLQFQPVVRLNSGWGDVVSPTSGVGTIDGFEALLRWDDPTHGQRPPLEFIELAEQTGDIVPVGRWVLENACRQLRAWQRLPGAQGLHMMINVSALELEQHDYGAVLERIVEESGVSPTSLVIEITEHVLVRDDVKVDDALKRLRAFGIRLANDDFGTGYNSLTYLRSLSVDVLKIDRSFVAEAVGSTQGTALFRAIVGVGAALGATIVAEGLEDREQLRLARSLGCHLGQGFVLAKPLDAADASALLESNEWPWQDVLGPVTPAVVTSRSRGVPALG